MLVRHGVPAVRKEFLIVKTFRFLFLLIVAACLLSLPALSEDVLHISGRVPVQAIGRELSAVRPANAARQISAERLGPAAHHWKLQATLPGAVVHDLSFPTAKIGYAAAEL